MTQVTTQTRLTAPETRLLWKSLIRQNTPELTHLAPLAQQALELCRRFHIDLNHPLFLYHDDTRLFQGWAKQMKDVQAREDRVPFLSPFLIEDLLMGLSLLKSTRDLKGINRVLRSPFFAISTFSLLDASASQKPSQWVILFKQQLALWGFPGNRELNTAEQQTLLQFNHRLGIYKKFDNIISLWDFDEAFEELKIICAEPPKLNSANPFIPFELQKNIIFEEMTADTPVREFPPINTKKSVISQDFQAPIVDPKTLKHRSSQIFKDQSACPFRAFAHHRLHAKKSELPQLGLTAIQRGNIIHHILELIWKVIQNQQTLLSYSPEKLAELIDISIENSFKKNNIFSEIIFLNTEKTRLRKLIFKWLEFEKKRQDFVVIATEESIETHLGSLPLRLRVDRIDKIGENQYLIIDYKTGKYNLGPDPLDEPQLPLYCIVSHLPIDSIAYAYVRTGAPELKIKHIKNLKDIWQDQLTALAEEFMAGYAKVNPKNGKQTCEYCDLGALCRIKTPTAPAL